jgi:integrase/recombinase XerD
MHLLQSGVDLTVIKNWLGHVNLDTTHAYVEIDLEMKRKALSSCAPVCKDKNLQYLIRQNNDIIYWLESLLL